MRSRQDSAEGKLRQPQHLLLLGAGHASLLLAAIGTALPIMPTTVFLLITAWCFGRALQDWEEHGTISPRAKRAAVLAMALSWLLVTVALRDQPASAVTGTCMAPVCLFILIRPSRPRHLAEPSGQE